MCPVTEPPAPPARVADVTSSPVRDLLELLNRPEVISFAGGPHRSYSNWMACSPPSARCYPVRMRRHLQNAPTEGNLDLRVRVAARMTTGTSAASARSIAPDVTP